MKKFLKISGVLFGTMLVCGMMLTSCKKEEDPNAGKTDPSTIATTNLIAYWAFEDSPKDEITDKELLTEMLPMLRAQRKSL